VTSVPSVTTWIGLLRQGDPAAAQALWQRYHTRLVHLAHDHLARRVRRVVDAEDVALEAFAGFCAEIARGRFPRVSNREDLWRLLFVLTLRRARDAARHESAERRGGGRVVLAGDLFDLPEADLDRLASPEPDPAWAAAVADEVAVLLAALPDQHLCRIARALLEGHTEVEIAVQLGCSLRTIERTRALIRQFWHERVKT
jgi:DNA-directed RNA polymerase specialized sigma24 family protein